jgi:hypothetical protein
LIIQAFHGKIKGKIKSGVDICAANQSDVIAAVGEGAQGEAFGLA